MALVWGKGPTGASPFASVLATMKGIGRLGSGCLPFAKARLDTLGQISKGGMAQKFSSGNTPRRLLHGRSSCKNAVCAII